MIAQLSVPTAGQGLVDITNAVADEVAKAQVAEGVCTVFIRHTSASLTIQENADPSARRDLERWLCRLVPEGDPDFTHTHEGPDDMPSHVKAALTSTSLSIPIANGQLGLGRWQGIYVWEHRTAGSVRECIVHIGG